MIHGSLSILNSITAPRISVQKIAGWYGSPLFAWAIIGFGILVRLIQYLRNASLWVDEAALATIIVKSPASSLLGYLETHTAAPAGFMLAEKWAVNTLGNSEYALRLLPLIAGVGALILLYPVAKKFVSPWAVPIVLILFGMSTSLVRFSTNVKQYSLDVFLALLVLLIAVQVIQHRHEVKWLIVYAIVGAVAIWLSFSIVFVLAGTGAVLGWQAVRERNWSKVLPLGLVGAFWLVSFSLSYFTQSIGEFSNPEILARFDARSRYVPLPPSSLADIRWIFDNSFELFRVPGGITLAGLGMLSFLVGCASLWKTDKIRLFLLIGPLLATALVSSAQLYPFFERFILFLVPMVLLLIAEGAAFIFAKTKVTYPAIGIGLAALLILHPIASEVFALVRSRGTEEVRPVVQYINQHRQAGDKLYVYPGAIKAFTYYADRFQIEESEYVIGAREAFVKYGRRDLNLFIDELDQLRGNSRVWFLFSNVQSDGYGIRSEGGIDEELFHLFYLDNLGVQLDQYRVRKAVVYLYDLSSTENKQTSLSKPQSKTN